jgi:hypothetical protein
MIYAPLLSGGLQNLSYIKMEFFVAGRFAGEIKSSLETFDAAPIFIPKRILNKIRNTQSDSVELSFTIEQVENNNNGGIPNE